MILGLVVFSWCLRYTYNMHTYEWTGRFGGKKTRIGWMFLVSFKKKKTHGFISYSLNALPEYST